MSDRNKTLDAHLVRRGDVAHAPGSPAGSTSSEMSWGTLQQLLEAVAPTNGHQAGTSSHTAGSSVPAPAKSGASSSSSAWKQWIVSPPHSPHSAEARGHLPHEPEVTSSVSQPMHAHLGRGKQLAEHAGKQDRNADTSAAAGSEAAPKPKRKSGGPKKGNIPWNKGLTKESMSEYQRPVHFGPKRRTGRPTGVSPPNRGKEMPAFVMTREGELRPRKRPGPQKGTNPWNAGLDSAAQQAYRLKKAREAGRRPVELVQGTT